MLASCHVKDGEGMVICHQGQAFHVMLDPGITWHQQCQAQPMQKDEQLVPSTADISGAFV